MAGYSEDLSFIHDAGFGGFARGAAPALLRAIRGRGIRSGLVVDLGCGSGIWAAALIAARFDVLGIDISPAMIRLAKKAAPSARFQAGSLLSATLPPCVAVTALGEAINYTFDPANGRDAVRALFRRVYDALCRGGIFIFDFAEPGQIQGAPPRRIWTAGEDWAVFAEAIEDKRRRTLTRNITSFRRHGSRYRRTDESHVIRLYAAKELLSDLGRIGFQAKMTRAYGSMRLRPGTAAIFAWKD